MAFKRSITIGKSPKEKAFVLDCSIASAWVFEDEDNAYANRVADFLTEATAYVPELWHLELANTLLVGERRKRTSEAIVTQFLQTASDFAIIVDSQTSLHAWGASVALARNHSLSVYDASYLEIAMRRGIPIATLDKSLLRAAQALGVSRLKV
jgi:predicted nucleic acid-binding protein